MVMSWLDSRPYDQIEVWLEYLVGNRAGSLKRVRVKKREDLLGEYTIQQLSLAIGPDRFLFTPRSRTTRSLPVRSSTAISWFMVGALARRPTRSGSTRQCHSYTRVLRSF